MSEAAGLSLVEIFAAFLLFLLSSALTVYIYLKTRTEKFLLYQILEVSAELLIGETIRDRLRSVYGKTPVETMHYVAIKITNASNSSIKNPDTFTEYERPMNISFGENTRVFSPSVKEFYPDNLKVSSRIEDGKVVINPVLLLPTNWFTVEMLVSGFQLNEPKVDCWIDGLQIKRQESPEVLTKRSRFYARLSAIAIPIFVVITIFLITGWQQYQHNLLFELILTLESTVPSEVLNAIEQLRANNWLTDGTLKGLDFSANNFSEMPLSGAYFQEVNLGAANLQGTDFTDADLRKAALAGADLRGAHLVGADLQGADLDYARLRGATLDNKSFDQTSILPDGTYWTPETDLSIYTDPHSYNAEISSMGIQFELRRNPNKLNNLYYLNLDIGDVIVRNYVSFIGNYNNLKCFVAWYEGQRVALFTDGGANGGGGYWELYSDVSTQQQLDQIIEIHKQDIASYSNICNAEDVMISNR